MTTPSARSSRRESAQRSARDYRRRHGSRARRCRFPQGARAMNAVFVSTSWPSSSSVPTAIDFNARHRPRTTADTRNCTSALKPRAASIIALRRIVESSGAGMRDCVASRRLAKTSDEARERASMARWSAFFSALPTRGARPGRRDRDAHRPRLRDRRHRDETVPRLIDAAQQEAMPVRKRAQPRRKRLRPAASISRRTRRRASSSRNTSRIVNAQRTSAPASRNAAAFSIASRSSAHR